MYIELLYIFIMSSWLVSTWTNIPTYHLVVVPVSYYTVGYPVPLIQCITYNRLVWTKLDTYYPVFSRIVSIT